MKVLYVAWHDPFDIDVGNGMDYFHYHAICNRGFDVKTIGPFNLKPARWERFIARAYNRTGKRYLKYPLSTSWRVSQAANKAVREWKPDVVFTMFLSALVFYNQSVPCVYSVDSTIYGVEKTWSFYGKPAMWVSTWQERRVLHKCKKLFTNSEWQKNIYTDIYKVPKEKIDIFPIVPTLPPDKIPGKWDIAWKMLKVPLRLLLVGKSFIRKGVDVAIETVRLLNTQGIPTELTVCGVDRRKEKFVHFVGIVNKNVPKQLAQYLDLYRNAHFLIHPSLFETAGIVPSEAAAFGTPTITNATGGLATTVEDGVSGIVLPKGSPPQAYADAIANLIHHPDRYYALCKTTRLRYERELNWDAVGRRFSDVFHQIAETDIIKKHPDKSANDSRS